MVNFVVSGLFLVPMVCIPMVCIPMVCIPMVCIPMHSVPESLYSFGSGFHEFLYSVIKSLKFFCEIAEFIPNQLRFHEKKLKLIFVIV